MNRPGSNFQSEVLSPSLPVTSWPRQICAFDIETSGKKPEICELFCAGLLVYKRAGFSWRRGKYRWFSVDQLSELGAFLHSFAGLIVGHNVFDFDYRVLRAHLSLEGIVEKTCDLRLLLHDIDHNRRARLKLESLVRLNLKRRKLYNSGKIPTLWREGQRRKVLAHNERDCELTAELWRHLLLRRKVRTSVQIGWDGEFRYSLGQETLSVLAGHTPQLTHPVWLKRIDEWGNAVRPPNYIAKTYIEEPNAGPRPLFHKLLCQNCQRAYILVARRNRQINKNETMGCPFCQHPVSLEEASTLSWGESPFATSFREDSCNFVRYHGQSWRAAASNFPDAKSARARIDSLRIWNW